MSRTMLIIEDNRAVRQSLEFYFQDSEWWVYCSKTAEECFTRFRDRKPDAAIVDLRLPRMSGECFIKCFLRVSPETIHLIYTGMHGYLIPEEISLFPQVCKQVFKKPCLDIGLIELAINRQIKKNNDPDPDYNIVL